MRNYVHRVLIFNPTQPERKICGYEVPQNLMASTTLLFCLRITWVCNSGRTWLGGFSAAHGADGGNLVFLSRQVNWSAGSKMFSRGIQWNGWKTGLPVYLTSNGSSCKQFATKSTMSASVLQEVIVGQNMLEMYRRETSVK